jgi:predicted chitinase
MGLSNAAKRARLYDLTINQQQGGGNKKAGFPYLVGRSSWSSIAINGTAASYAGCRSLKCMQFTANPNVRQSRPAGSSVTTTYWRNGANY